MASTVGDGSLDAIRAHDPNFDEAGFLAVARYAFDAVQRARAAGNPDAARGVLTDVVWADERSRSSTSGIGVAETLVSAAIDHAERSGDRDTIAVTFGVQRSDGAAGWEQWWFSRPASATTPTMGSGLACPYCGAPSAAGTDTCAYCHRLLSGGTLGWLVALIEGDGVPSPSVDTTLDLPPIVGRTVRRAVILAAVGVAVSILAVVLPLVLVFHFQASPSGASVPSAARSARAVGGRGLSSAQGSATAAPAISGTAQYTVTWRLTTGISLNGEQDDISPYAGTSCASLATGYPPGRTAALPSLHLSADSGDEITVNISVPGFHGPGVYNLSGLGVSLVGANSLSDTWTAAGAPTPPVLTLRPDGSGVLTLDAMPLEPQSTERLNPLTGTVAWTCADP
jgi:hypothetical protein